MATASLFHPPNTSGATCRRRSRGRIGSGSEKAQELKPDIILLDIGLPNLNGLEAANRIRQVAPDAAIIFLTQNSDKEIIRAALNTGARAYVLKTDAGTELLRAVAGVLGGV